MPIFISYSHADAEFVENLAKNLVVNRVSLWLDRWELSIGDSITAKIQDAVTEASGLLVVISKHSVASEWCKRELNAGLFREMDEKRVVVMPVLLENCDVPLFLKDKLYADFRTSFDQGFRTIMEGLAKVTNEWQARIESAQFHTDWSMDWGTSSKGSFTRIVMVESAKGQPYTVLSNIMIHDPNARSPSEALATEHLNALAAAVTDERKWTARLPDQLPLYNTFGVPLPGRRYPLEVMVETRRLGQDTGRDVLLHWGQQLRRAAEHHNSVRIAHRSGNDKISK